MKTLLVGCRVDICPYLEVGSVFVVAPGHLGIGPALVARHFSEFAVLALGATWHPHGERCPTWVDSECRCMLGEEA